MPRFYILLVFGMLEQLYGHYKGGLFWLVHDAKRKVFKEKDVNSCAGETPLIKTDF